MYIVFSSNTCPYCPKAVTHIKNNTQEACTVVNVTEEIHDKLKQIIQSIDPRQTHLTVPQIFRIHDPEVQYDDGLEFLECARKRSREDDDLIVEYIGGHEDIVNYFKES